MSDLLINCDFCNKALISKNNLIITCGKFQFQLFCYHKKCFEESLKKEKKIKWWKKIIQNTLGYFYYRGDEKSRIFYLDQLDNSLKVAFMIRLVSIPFFAVSFFAILTGVMNKSISELWLILCALIFPLININKTVKETEEKIKFN